MPKSLEITTKITADGKSGKPHRAPCPNNCGFCPQDQLRYAWGERGSELTLSQFSKVLNKLPEDVEIHFSGFTEPFFNRKAPNMIALAKEAGRVVHLYTTLMGLDEDGALVLRELKGNPMIDFVMIHFPDTRNLLLPSEAFIAQHILWRTTGIGSRAMAMGPLPQAVRKYVDNLGWPNGVELTAMNTRAGNLERMSRNDTPLQGYLDCSDDRWHSNVMLPNGDVYLCCMDYSLTTKLGNLFEQPYSDIYAEAEALRCETPDLCRKCDRAVPRD